MDVVATLAQMPDVVFDKPLVCRTIITNPEFSAILDRKMAEAQAEATAMVKAKGDVMYAPNDRSGVHEMVKSAITDLDRVPQDDAAASVNAALVADEVAAAELDQSNG